MVDPRDAVGVPPVATRPPAGQSTFDLPTVTVLTPTGVITGGGPALQIRWNYTQAQDRPQGQWRVSIATTPDQVVVYDTGWRRGDVTEHVITTTIAGIPLETTGGGLTLTVQAIAEGVPQAGQTTSVFDIQWGTVTGVITTPPNKTSVGTSQITVNWSYTSTRGHPQKSWQVKLLDRTRVVYDSGYVPGTDLTHTPSFVLVDGRTYQARLVVENAQGVHSRAWTATFEVNLASGEVGIPEPDVGLIYEIGLGGRGYMLYDNRDGVDAQYRYGRRTGGLQSERFATGSTPFEQAIDRYSFGSMSDFRAGRGQEFADREHSTGSGYLESEGVDPFTPGRVSLLNAVEAEFTHIYTDLHSTVIGERLFVQTGVAQISYSDMHSGASVPIDVGNAGTLTGLTTDGAEWYACDGATVHRGILTSTRWSSVALDRISYAAGRIIGSYKTSGSTGPNRFTTLNGDGVEEVSNGRLTLSDGWDINEFTSGSGYVWFSAFNGNRSAVYAWKAGTEDSPFLAYEHQTGSRIVGMLWEQGQIVTITHDQNETLSLWRLIPGQDGTLTPFLIDQYGESVAPKVSLVSHGSRVYFSWPTMTPNTSGVGILDLASGGYCKGYAAGTVGEVASINIWQSKIVITIPGGGVWRERDTYVTNGYVETSHFDAASTLEKVYDSITVLGDPLRSGESILITYSTDNSETYQSIPTGLLGTTGLQEKTVHLGVKARAMSARVNLHSTGATTPVLTVVSLKYHQLGLADTILTLPIDCSDHVRGLNGAELPNARPGGGAERVRALETLVQTRVSVQDVDWHDTADTETYEMLDVDVTKRSVYNRALGKQQVQQIAVCILRKEQR